jgi:hypothetical protein
MSIFTKIPNVLISKIVVMAINDHITDVQPLVKLLPSGVFKRIPHKYRSIIRSLMKRECIFSNDVFWSCFIAACQNGLKVIANKMLDSKSHFSGMKKWVDRVMISVIDLGCIALFKRIVGLFSDYEDIKGTETYHFIEIYKTDSFAFLSNPTYMDMHKRCMYGGVDIAKFVTKKLGLFKLNMCVTYAVKIGKMDVVEHICKGRFEFNDTIFIGLCKTGNIPYLLKYAKLVDSEMVKSGFIFAVAGEKKEVIRELIANKHIIINDVKNNIEGMDIKPSMVQFLNDLIKK